MTFSHKFDPTSLREYDIRGIVGRTLKPEDAYAIGRTFGFYFFLILTRILPFLGTLIDWTLSRYSPEQFFDTRTDSTFSCTHPDSTIFRYSY